MTMIGGLIVDKNEWLVTPYSRTSQLRTVQLTRMPKLNTHLVKYHQNVYEMGKG